jgi:hypothetical protein
MLRAYVRQRTLRGKWNRRKENGSFVGLIVADREALLSFFAEPGKFYNADPYYLSVYRTADTYWGARQPFCGHFGTTFHRQASSPGSNYLRNLNRDGGFPTIGTRYPIPLVPAWVPEMNSSQTAICATITARS